MIIYSIDFDWTLLILGQIYPYFESMAKEKLWFFFTTYLCINPWTSRSLSTKALMIGYWFIAIEHALRKKGSTLISDWINCSSLIKSNNLFASISSENVNDGMNRDSVETIAIYFPFPVNSFTLNSKQSKDENFLLICLFNSC